MTAAQQVSILKDLGATNYRADVADAGMAQTVANALNGAFKGSGISILPCINPIRAGAPLRGEVDPRSRRPHLPCLSLSSPRLPLSVRLGRA